MINSEFTIRFPNLIPYAEIKIDEKPIIISAHKQLCSTETISFEQEGIRVSATVTGHDGYFLLHQELQNKSGKPIRLAKLGFRTPQDNPIQCVGAPSDWFSMGGDLREILPSANDLRIKYCQGRGEAVTGLSDDPVACDGRYRTAKDFFTVSNGGNGLIMAPFHNPEAFIQYCGFVQDGTIALDFYSDMTDILISPDEVRHAQDIYIAFGNILDHFNSVLHNLAVTHGSRTGKGPKCGWCSWYDLAEHITEESITATLDKILEIKNQVKFDFFQIDDGYQIANGCWLPNEKFPDSFRNIIKNLNENDIMPGIWLAPTSILADTDFANHHPEALAKNPDGTFIDGPTNWKKKSYWADPTHPIFLDLVKKSLEQLIQIGFRYFKIDFNAIVGRFYNSTMTSLQAFRNLYRYYRSILGEDCYLLSCTGCVTRGTFGYADGSRVGADSLQVWESYHTQVLKNYIPSLVSASPVNGIIYACDPDVTYLRSTLPENEIQIWHSLVGLNAGVQMISDPLQNRTENEIRRYEILCPPSVEQGLPVAYGAANMCEQFGFIANRDFGNFGVFLYTNMDDQNKDFAIFNNKLSELNGPFHVWSYWDEKYLGIYSSDLILENVEAHSCKLLRFTPVSDKPTTIGSTFHISVGATEIEEDTFTNQIQQIKLNNSGARTGSLYIHSSNRPYSIQTNAELTSWSYEKQILKIDFKRTGPLSIGITYEAKPGKV